VVEVGSEIMVEMVRHGRCRGWQQGSESKLESSAGVEVDNGVGVGIRTRGRDGTSKAWSLSRFDVVVAVEIVMGRRGRDGLQEVILGMNRGRRGDY